MNLDSYFIPYFKINSKCIKDLNVRENTIEVLGENILIKQHGLYFLEMISKAQRTKEKIGTSARLKMSVLKDTRKCKDNSQNGRGVGLWQEDVLDFSTGFGVTGFTLI